MVVVGTFDVDVVVVVFVVASEEVVVVMVVMAEQTFEGSREEVDRGEGASMVAAYIHSKETDGHSYSGAILKI